MPPKLITDDSDVSEFDNESKSETSNETGTNSNANSSGPTPAATSRDVEQTVTSDDDYDESFENSDESEAELKKSTAYSYDDIYPILDKLRREGAKKYKQSISETIERHCSGAIAFKAIEINPTGEISPPRNVHKPSGYDENFKLETKSRLETLDSDFELKEANINFSMAFKYSRYPTHSYIHFRGGKKRNCSTTGHSGGFFKPIEELTGETASSPQERRSLSISAIKGLSSTKGENKVGSVSSAKGILKPGFFHSERQMVIDAVIDEAANGSPSLKKAAPVKATIEALKFVVSNTVGFRDNTDENQTRFRGLTTDGLNLEDPISRTYALKHYQSVKDSTKIAILKYEHRLNDTDSCETSDIDEQTAPSKQIALLNRKLTRTILAPKYHKNTINTRGQDPEQSRLSPLRYESPYSMANIDITLAMLKGEASYIDICSAYNSPIPVIIPTEELCTDYERRLS